MREVRHDRLDRDLVATLIICTACSLTVASGLLVLVEGFPDGHHEGTQRGTPSAPPLVEPGQTFGWRLFRCLFLAGGWERRIHLSSRGTHSKRPALPLLLRFLDVLALEPREAIPAPRSCRRATGRSSRPPSGSAPDRLGEPCRTDGRSCVPGTHVGKRTHAANKLEAEAGIGAEPSPVQLFHHDIARTVSITSRGVATRRS